MGPLLWEYKVLASGPPGEVVLISSPLSPPVSALATLVLSQVDPLILDASSTPIPTLFPAMKHTHLCLAPTWPLQPQPFFHVLLTDTALTWSVVELAACVHVCVLTRAVSPSCSTYVHLNGDSPSSSIPPKSRHQLLFPCFKKKFFLIYLSVLGLSCGTWDPLLWCTDSLQSTWARYCSR